MISFIPFSVLGLIRLIFDFPFRTRRNAVLETPATLAICSRKKINGHCHPVVVLGNVKSHGIGFQNLGNAEVAVRPTCSGFWRCLEKDTRFRKIQNGSVIQHQSPVAVLFPDPQFGTGHPIPYIRRHANPYLYRGPNVEQALKSAP